MSILAPSGEASTALSERILARIKCIEGSILDDLKFLSTWGKGTPPGLADFLRMRQLSRANPLVADRKPPAGSDPT